MAKARHEFHGNALQGLSGTEELSDGASTDTTTHMHWSKYYITTLTKASSIIHAGLMPVAL